MVKNAPKAEGLGLCFELGHGVAPVCMFDAFHLTFNFKCKVSRDVFLKTNVNVN